MVTVKATYLVRFQKRNLTREWMETQVSALVYNDLMGPFPHPSINKEKYVFSSLIIIQDIHGCTFSIKKQRSLNFQKFKSLVEKLFVTCPNLQDIFMFLRNIMLHFMLKFLINDQVGSKII